MGRLRLGQKVRCLSAKLMIELSDIRQGFVNGTSSRLGGETTALLVSQSNAAGMETS